MIIQVYWCAPVIFFFFQFVYRNNFFLIDFPILNHPGTAVISSTWSEYICCRILLANVIFKFLRYIFISNISYFSYLIPFLLHFIINKELFIYSCDLKQGHCNSVYFKAYVVFWYEIIWLGIFQLLLWWLEYSHMCFF